MALNSEAIFTRSGPVQASDFQEVQPGQNIPEIDRPNYSGWHPTAPKYKVKAMYRKDGKRYAVVGAVSQFNGDDFLSDSIEGVKQRLRAVAEEVGASIEMTLMTVTTEVGPTETVASGNPTVDTLMDRVKKLEETASRGTS